MAECKAVEAVAELEHYYDHDKNASSTVRVAWTHTHRIRSESSQSQGVVPRNSNRPTFMRHPGSNSEAIRLTVHDIPAPLHLPEQAQVQRFRAPPFNSRSYALVAGSPSLPETPLPV